MFRLRIVLIFCFFAAASSILTSCKKGDGDPFFSIYSRSARLCGEWKISNYTQTVKSGNKAWITDINGDKKTYTTQVDTTMMVLVPAPHDTTFKMESKHTWTGSTEFTYVKDGTYDILENYKDDSTSMAWTAEEKGRWYFLSANKDSGFKNKELLGMQPVSYVYNPDAGSSSSTHYMGNSASGVVEIYELKNKEIIFKTNTEETINSVVVSTTMEMTLLPR
ncbi:MAG: hypothetical protein WCM76_05475 [Bacteroidota bacterium]